MKYHILNGDGILNGFKDTGIPGDVLIMRECLIVGDLGGNNLDEFIIRRTHYLATKYNSPPDEYSILSLIESIKTVPSGSVFNLWFEYDLFARAISGFSFI